MKREWKETRKYDTYGMVRITYEFMGDINDSDFRNFKRNCLCKEEKDSYKLNNYPKGYHAQCLETEKLWADRGEYTDYKAQK